ncbi:N-acetylmuramoyl-L-alanine amidase family protein [Ulvibacterium marinum]|uniref:N-acetylmuramoyl-L-alanine amidase family protein n=1 Tax=Ulvibacterium marinum TaxID=2419782 RepID=UPI002495033B|nr:N-acetylmuramoyl-L-alanine amidase [Ulvibacterium marinum]
MNLKRFFPIIFFLSVLVLSAFNKNNTELINNDPFVVVLDAGHGGHDPGNLGNGYLEKNIALKIVLKVGEMLESNPDIKVVYTRKDDTFVDLFVRGEIANKANADLFVSVHCDSHSSDAHGAGTFVLGLHANKQNFEIAKKENSVIYLEDNYETRYADYDINSPESIIGLTIMQEEFLDQSIMLAKIMQDKFSEKLKRNDRKVKQAGFIVLHQTFMPSVLVETGFLTNRSEGAYLNSQKGQTEMGTAIAEAILKYKNGVQANTANVPIQATPEVPLSKDETIISEKTVQTKTEEPNKKQPDPTLDEVEKVAEAEKVDSSSSTTLENAPKGIDIANSETPKQNSDPIKNKETAPPIKNKELSPKPSADIIFKIQLLASSKDLNPTSDNFKGLNRISKEPYNNLFRYFYGSTSSYREAGMLKRNADLKGYTTSFIVAYKDGKRISLPEALKYVSE